MLLDLPPTINRYFAAQRFYIQGPTCVKEDTETRWKKPSLATSNLLVSSY